MGHSRACRQRDRTIQHSATKRSSGVIRHGGVVCLGAPGGRPTSSDARRSTESGRESGFVAVTKEREGERLCTNVCSRTGEKQPKRHHAPHQSHSKSKPRRYWPAREGSPFQEVTDLNTSRRVGGQGAAGHVHLTRGKDREKKLGIRRGREEKKRRISPGDALLNKAANERKNVPTSATMMRSGHVDAAEGMMTLARLWTRNFQCHHRLGLAAVRLVASIEELLLLLPFEKQNPLVDELHVKAMV